MNVRGGVVGGGGRGSLPPMTAPPAQLLALRHEIDALDHALVTLLAQRRTVVAQVARLKASHGLPPLDPAREAAMRADLHRQGAAQGVPAPLLDAVLNAVLEDSHVLVAAPRQ